MLAAVKADAAHMGARHSYVADYSNITGPQLAICTYVCRLGISFQYRNINSVPTLHLHTQVYTWGPVPYVRGERYGQS